MSLVTAGLLGPYILTDGLASLVIGEIEDFEPDAATLIAVTIPDLGLFEIDPDEAILIVP